MANKLLNIYAENGANIIDDDTTAPTLTIINTSSQPGFAGVNTGTSVGLQAIQGAIANSTIAAFQAVQSAASGVFLDFQGGVLSTASLNLAANQTAGAIRVSFNNGGVVSFGYITIIKGVV